MKHWSTVTAADALLEPMSETLKVEGGQLHAIVAPCQAGLMVGAGGGVWGETLSSHSAQGESSS
ncbi:hypothetical protein JZ751_020910 [Albula glossodonta]|uniref:Uncharacterized protein n=1 Tax=Albula glossodonta TaxID=121402 RepID=A0A8T2PKR9_9TELE|nr:hypothetical protein JZ751_020910 [Albula glossodonta]